MPNTKNLEKQDTKYPYCGAEMPPDTRIPKTPWRALQNGFVRSFGDGFSIGFSGWHI